MGLLSFSRAVFPDDATSYLVFEETPAGFCVKGNDGVTMYTAELRRDKMCNMIIVQDQNHQPAMCLMEQIGKMGWKAYTPNYLSIDRLDAPLYMTSTTPTQMNVSFAHSKTFKYADLVVKGSVTDKTLAIYNADTSMKLAYILPLSKRGKFVLQIQPGFLDVFAVSLVLLHAGMKHDGGAIPTPCYFQPTNQQGDGLPSVEQDTLNGAAVVGCEYILNAAASYIVDKVTPYKYTISEEGGSVLTFSTSLTKAFFGNRIALQDANHKEIAMLVKKATSSHERWVAYCSSENGADKHMLFSVFKNNKTQKYTNLNVHLGEQKGRDVFPDLSVTGNWPKGVCTIFHSDSPVPIAKMIPLAELSKFKVEVHSNQDSAFVLALAVLVDAIERPAGFSFPSGEVLGLGVKAVGIGLVAGLKFTIGALT